MSDPIRAKHKDLERMLREAGGPGPWIDMSPLDWTSPQVEYLREAAAHCGAFGAVAVQLRDMVNKQMGFLRETGEGTMTAIGMLDQMKAVVERDDPDEGSMLAFREEQLSEIREILEVWT